MHGLGRFLFLTLINNFVICTTLDLQLINFDYSSLQNYNLSNFLPILNPPNFIDMAALYGHTAESYEVVTEDGYILTVFHIRGSRPSLPILLFHGLMDSADTWIVRGETSLAVTLANANYDIWLGNVRGNRYSRRHLFLNPDVDPDFWNFSFDEHGLYDLPATVDYVLNKTGAPKLNMFGHSQGNMMMWVLLSTRTEYNEKINVATALAPVCFLQYIQPPMLIVNQLVPVLYVILRSLGVTSLFGDNSLETLSMRVISRIPVLGYLLVAYDFLFAVCGYDPAELGPHFLRTLTLHFPTWASLKNFAHFAQIQLKNVFGRFDYGAAGNRAAYNSSIAPIYPLGKITTKVVLLATLNDKLAPIADVDRLRRLLPNVVRYVINPRVIMNHIDYVWGKTVKDYLYGYIFDVLEKYN